MINNCTKWIVTVVFLHLIGGCEADGDGLDKPMEQNITVYNIPEPPVIPSKKVGFNEHRIPNETVWTGKYRGTLPCTDCPGIETTLILIGDGTYSISETYLETGAEPFGSNGRFTWDVSGKIITLDAEGGGRSYKVEKNALRALDKDGKTISGKFSENYILNNSESEFSGAYVWGHEVHLFSPCDGDDAYWVRATSRTIEELIGHYKLKSTKPYQGLFVRFRGHLILNEELNTVTDSYDGLIRINEVLEWDVEVPIHCRGR